MRLTERLVMCATCARRVREAEAEELGWIAELDRGGDLARSCPLCARLCPLAAARPSGLTQG